ncbi:helix-turn-helix domain-containing protein [Streptomyces sviceus]|uniref:helix-turn-helix domain-containing protein n=1 Tax=Streptomyces sviceus TaxID=285530 RepID=UPI0036A9FC33
MRRPGASSDRTDIDCAVPRCYCAESATGVPPLAYLSQHRVEIAASLLLHTDQSVATAVGWPDPNCFARRFRLQFGLRPSTYRSTFSFNSGRCAQGRSSPGARCPHRRRCRAVGGDCGYVRACNGRIWEALLRSYQIYKFPEDHRRALRRRQVSAWSPDQARVVRWAQAPHRGR